VALQMGRRAAWPAESSRAEPRRVEPSRAESSGGAAAAAAAQEPMTDINRAAGELI